MNIEKLIPLMKKIERQIIGILYVHGYVNNVSKFEDVELTPKGMSLVKTDVVITDEQVELYRSIFPTGSKGPGVEAVRVRLEKFISTHECTFEDVLKAAQLYVNNHTTKGLLVMGAHYFLSKRDQDSKVTESKCEEYLEEVNKKNDTKDWREELT